MNKGNEYKGESFTIESRESSFPGTFLEEFLYYYKMQNGTKVCVISFFQRVPLFFFFFLSLESKRPSLAFDTRKYSPSVSL